MPLRHLCAMALVIVLLSSHIGCAEISKIAKKSWHEKYSWKAEFYFEDPQVIALCHAIETGDLQEIDRLVAAGANVNAIGKGNMTPLLWAYPDNKPERFKRILEHGANPNVIFKSDFNTGQSTSFPGSSVTHLASETWFPKYFEYVFQHGGDPNLEKTSTLGRGDTPLHVLIKGPSSHKNAKVNKLIELKANLDHESASEITPVRLAVGRGQYDTALQLLNAGADYSIYKKNHNSRLVHKVLTQERRLPQCTLQQKKDYQKLVTWLKDHGESFDEARADFKRWKSWVGTPKYKKKMRDKEIAARKAKEQREREEEAAQREAQAKP